MQQCFSENRELHSKVYFIPKHFCYLKLATHFMRSKKLTKKQKIFSEKRKDLGMVCHIAPLNKVKKQGENAITQPRSNPIPKFYIFLMGWDRGCGIFCF